MLANPVDIHNPFLLASEINFILYSLSLSHLFCVPRWCAFNFSFLTYQSMYIPCYKFPLVLLRANNTIFLFLCFIHLSCLSKTYFCLCHRSKRVNDGPGLLKSSSASLPTSTKVCLHSILLSCELDLHDEHLLISNYEIRWLLYKLINVNKELTHNLNFVSLHYYLHS